MKIMSWFFDFDDTLVGGVLSYALNVSFPKLVAKHNLPFDQARFDQMFSQAQERSSREQDFVPILSEFFAGMEWSAELEHDFLRDLQASYQPTIFDDALELLRGLAHSGQVVYVISNNVSSPQIATQLGIMSYVREVFTPRLLGDVPPKPNPALWKAIMGRYPSLRSTSPVFVGDDPWSDGAFADACGIPCWIVDRRGRFNSLVDRTSYQWVKSLREIPIS